MLFVLFPERVFSGLQRKYKLEVKEIQKKSKGERIFKNEGVRSKAPNAGQCYTVSATNSTLRYWFSPRMSGKIIWAAFRNSAAPAPIQITYSEISEGGAQTSRF